MNIHNSLNRNQPRRLQKKKSATFVFVFSLLPSVVCHAETASGFNTSVIHELSPEMDNHQHRRRRNAGYEGIFGLAEYEGTESTISPHTQGRRSAKEHLSPTWPKPPTRPQSRYRTTPATQPTHDDKEVWTLYGLFQLSNHLVCSDGTTPSPNICDKNCSGEFQFVFVNVTVTTLTVCAP